MNSDCWAGKLSSLKGTDFIKWVIHSELIQSFYSFDFRLMLGTVLSIEKKKKTLKTWICFHSERQFSLVRDRQGWLGVWPWVVLLGQQETFSLQARFHSTRRSHASWCGLRTHQQSHPTVNSGSYSHRHGKKQWHDYYGATNHFWLGFMPNPQEESPGYQVLWVWPRTHSWEARRPQGWTYYYHSVKETYQTTF